jgi:hypothetical protein
LGATSSTGKEAEVTKKLIYCPELGGDREDPGFPPGWTVETGWPNRNHTEAELLWLGRLPYTLYEHVLNQMRFAHQGHKRRQELAKIEATLPARRRRRDDRAADP